jgi:hypothetical protein
MGWSFPWISTANSEFNVDLGYSSSEQQTRAWLTPQVEAGMPPIAARNARETGTDVVGYLTESFGFSAFVLDDGTIYHTYSTAGRGVEFLMSYYGILDRAPKGREEGEGFQLWIRRHDEYGKPMTGAERAAPDLIPPRPQQRPVLSQMKVAIEWPDRRLASERRSGILHQLAPLSALRFDNSFDNNAGGRP